MIFNLTLLVQIFNFLLAYYLLSRWLFKPALDQIERREQYLINLQAKRDQRTQELALLAQQQQAAAREAGLLFMPILEAIQDASNFDTPEIPKLRPTKLSPEILKKIETEVTSQVVKQVQRV